MASITCNDRGTRQDAFGRLAPWLNFIECSSKNESSSAFHHKP